MAALVKDYSYFDNEAYYETYFKDPAVEPWCLQKLHSFWKQFESAKNLNFLEFGGGPNISKLVTACSYVEDIVFSEYTESIRKAVEDWINKKGFDWKPTFDYVVKELEGKDEQASNLRQEELRSKIKALIPCDITANEPLDTSTLTSKLCPPYDVVLTSLCLEAVVESDQEYKDSVLKLSKLVKSGGILVMHGMMEQSYYKVGKYDFYSYKLTKDCIIGSLQEAGIKDIEFDIFSWKDDPTCDAQGEFFVHGKRE